MTYFIVFTEPAKEDLFELQSYIAERSVEGARTWLDALKQATESLRHHPEGCSLAPENVDHEETIRQFLFRTRKGKTYRGLFIVKEQLVFVLHLRGPGQDLLSAEDIEIP